MQTVFSWATEANYPNSSNPWALTPTKVAPVGDLITPNTKPPAQNFNYIFNQIAGNLQYLFPIAPQAGEVWRPTFNAGGPSGVTFGGSGAPQMFKPAYDYQVGAWLVPFVLVAGGDWSTHLGWSFGQDDQAGWTTPIGGNASIATFDTTGFIDMAACADPATPGIVWVASLSANNETLVVKDSSYTSGSWTSQYSLTTVGTVPLTVEMASIGSHVVVGVGGTSGSIIALYNGTTGGGWAPVAGVGGTNHQGWSIMSNGSLLIALPTLVRAASPVLWTSPDGVTFTSRSIATQIPVGAFAAGLTWSAVTQLWYMAVQVTAASTAFWSSPDGINWTQTSVGAGPDLSIADLGCGQNGLVLTVADATILGVAQTEQIYYSPDYGATWYLSPAALQGNANLAVIGYSRARLATGPTQLCVGNSSYGRFSDIVGLPAHI